MIGFSTSPEACPPVKKYNFHSYTGGGRTVAANSVLKGRAEITDEFTEIIFKCQLCGYCQVGCHTFTELTEPTEIARELKVRCVEEGRVKPEHMAMIEGMKKEDNPFGEPKEKRGEWSDGLDLKDLNEEKAEVIFHAGCRLSYDEDLRSVVRGAAILLKEAGVDFGIFGREEACCGGRLSI